MISDIASGAILVGLSSRVWSLSPCFSIQSNDEDLYRPMDRRDAGLAHVRCLCQFPMAPAPNGFYGYNALQQLACFAMVFIFGPLSILTGIAMSPALANRNHVPERKDHQFIVIIGSLLSDFTPSCFQSVSSRSPITMHLCTECFCLTRPDFEVLNGDVWFLCLKTRVPNCTSRSSRLDSCEHFSTDGRGCSG
jgi:hypothetical protein